MTSYNIFPKKLSDFDFYNNERSIYQLLYNSVNDINNLQHLLIVGHTGIGKKTRIYALLSHILGDSIYKMKYNCIEYSNIKITFKYSCFHTEINIKDYNLQEIDIIYNYLKEYSQSLNIGFNIPKIIIIHNINYSDIKFQKKLKILFDNNINTSRFILLCNSSQNVIDDIISRCLTIRIPSPKKEEIKKILIKTANKYEIKYKDSELDIIINSCLQEDIFPNIKNIINKLEFSYITDTFILYKLNYVKTLDEILNILLKKNAIIKNIIHIRNLTNKLYVNTVQPNYIVTYITNKLTTNNKISDNNKHKILHHANLITLQLIKCHKGLIILEYFFIGIIKILNIKI